MNSPTEHGTSSLRLLVARLTWMLIGPATLVIIGLKIASAGDGWLTRLDAIFFGVVGMILMARWSELKSGEGRDSFGEPSTIATFPRFVRTFAAVAIAAWTIANIMGNHILN
ncbi:MAG TPA: hypothetical protein VND64_05525 [Pirellulales bacterium]|nr:hypothetical protein [Pirellulales bacterium]